MQATEPAGTPDSAEAKPSRAEGAPDPLFWTRRFSLTTRILAVNTLIVLLVLGGLFVLDTYRKQLIIERSRLARSEVEIIANALAEAPASEHPALLARIGDQQRLRLRTFDSQGALQTDSFVVGEPAFVFADPEQQDWVQSVARATDRAVDFLVGAPPVPPYDPAADPANGKDKTDKSQWPEVFVAEQARAGTVMLRHAPDRTPVITAAAPYGPQGETLLTMRNAVDITTSIRTARQTLLILLTLAMLFSMQLSLFLARTIVQPLRTLSRAAQRVSAGREREVVIPRLPERQDEIGNLARSLSDMTQALRDRIDAGEAFSADVSHELKNPLASLRSALDTLENVDDPDLRRQLAEIAQADVRRIDRLITEIAEASRLDAELSRTRFEPVDLLTLAQNVLGGRTAATRIGEERELSFEIKSAPTRATTVMGDAAQLERVLENLIDNAASFSPHGGCVAIDFDDLGDQVELTVTDDGPGIAEEEREAIFERFHSHRPEPESFGKHSGLGLAIARGIIVGHGGTLFARGRDDGESGAVFAIRLPAHDAGSAG
ncbi:HAMP domain-containing sensor histidine kinase [Croceicoccus mobilis]|uniref:histidine kinase n=1 Tax=Croceicoccus mobilis TaxID=1703339 RepID=A0A917DWQ4_9SPHN|nr:HAMP domain-containing sensor histidine kinase [Croceicoccus mobilis]GGD77665.1 sensor histidine kinase [Croceicoccus mobilis]